MAEVQQQDGQTVALRYEPTVADMAGALNARMRATPSGRRTRRLLLFAGVMGIGVVALQAAVGDGDLTVLVAGVALTVLAFGSLYLLPSLQARQLHPLAARQGEFGAVVDDTGIRLTTRDSTSTTKWEMYPRYAETDELFVLLTADKHSVGVMVLPKRGVSAPDDVDRLRALLDEHVRRV
ncbi:YcxB family protein [Streptomyces sp. PKU-EA00015]|uniref:YcxB family protein n=1 Tax=Streptomyces sp. PKU-EA00015 TaxID=2748326 RepID=UPI0015A118DE|nr:YcxB family protein [Streptomyces sp. PKU-EA00015]NWF29986.1 YcxB family protein [Streptomyces sp. PKU-EA00015]